MLHSAHIFMGKEFAPVVESIGLNLEKEDPQATEYINLYNLTIKESGLHAFRKLNIEKTQDMLSIPVIDWESIENEPEETFSSFWSTKIQDDILSVKNASDQNLLYVFIHFPLYQRNIVANLKKLCSAIKEAKRQVKVDLIGYGDDLVKFINPESLGDIVPSADLLPAIKDMYKDLDYSPQNNHLVFIQNRLRNGMSLLSAQDGFAPFHDMLTQLTLIFASYYNQVFDSRVQARDVVGIGFSSIYFDSYLFADYLLHKTMMSVIDNQSANNNDVDINEANKQANEILKYKTSILSKFFDQWKGHESEIKDKPEAYNEIKQQVQEISDKISKYFKDNKDITVKAALLASLLSKSDCELFSNSVYNPANICFDELYKEAIDYFINEDNADYYMIDGQKPVNPISDLKEINLQLMQSEVMVRELDEQKKHYEEQIEQTEKVRECFIDEDGFFSFEDKKYRLLPDFDEEPLKDSYEEHQVRSASIDLRSGFRSIQSQGQQGSCLSFTLTSIFEYMMNAGGKKEYDLSEAFLYYNARNLDKTGDINVNEDNGSRFHPSIEALMTYGLALEKVWPYNDGVYSVKPSQEAYNDAATRKLVKALNVRLNSDAIKSALEDGYPVAGCFILCSSFYNSGGYISMPTPEEIKETKTQSEDKDKKSRHGCHAMAIVGYSDQLKMFLVRNSWGVDWGDKGYCYIPYDYINNPDLFKFACIFAEIASLDFKKPELKEMPVLKIDNEDLRIKYYVTIAKYQEQLAVVKSLREQRNSLVRYFEEQKKLYSDANKRDEFVSENKTKLEEENTLLKEANNEINNKLNVNFEEFKSKRNAEIINLIFVIVGSSLGLLGWNYLTQYFDNLWINYLWLVPIGVIYTLIAYLHYRKYWKEWRNRRDELTLQFENNKKAIAANDCRISLFRYKAFAAWNTITALEKVNLKLEHLYTNVISLINNLRVWYKESKEFSEDMKLTSTFPNISLLDKNILDAYFAKKLSQSKVCEMDLTENIEQYEIKPEYLAKHKTEIKNNLKNRLIGVLQNIDFDISAHVSSDKFEEIARKVDISMLNDWNNQAQLFVHVHSTLRAQVETCDTILVPNLNMWRNQLSDKIYMINHSLHGANNRYRITLLRTATLNFDECVALCQPPKNRRTQIVA